MAFWAYSMSLGCLDPGWYIPMYARPMFLKIFFSPGSSWSARLYRARAVSYLPTRKLSLPERISLRDSNLLQAVAESRMSRPQTAPVLRPRDPFDFMRDSLLRSASPETRSRRKLRV